MSLEENAAAGDETGGGEERHRDANVDDGVILPQAKAQEYCPAELTSTNRWIPWVLDNGDKKPLVRWSDPASWSSFADARAKAPATGGVGIVFIGDGLGGVDLDACRDPATGALTEWAREIIDDFRSYTEISPSGTGVKIFALGAIDDARQLALGGQAPRGLQRALEGGQLRRRLAQLGGDHVRCLARGGQRPLGLVDAEAGSELLMRERDVALLHRLGAVRQAAREGGLHTHSDADSSLEPIGPGCDSPRLAPGGRRCLVHRRRRTGGGCRCHLPAAAAAFSHLWGTLMAGRCQFILDDEVRPGQPVRFCSKPATRRSYCDEHDRVCYRPNRDVPILVHSAQRGPTDIELANRLARHVA